MSELYNKCNARWDDKNRKIVIKWEEDLVKLMAMSKILFAFFYTHCYEIVMFYFLFQVKKAVSGNYKSMLTKPAFCKLHIYVSFILLKSQFCKVVLEAALQLS